MPFGASVDRTASARARSESPFLRMPEGFRVIRVRDMEETSYWSYYLEVSANGQKQGRSITVGPNDPIKRHMDALGKDHPDYKPARKRMMLNIIDRTPVKRDSQGSVFYPGEDMKYPEVSPVTQESLRTSPPTTHNRPMVLDFGPELMKDFIILHNRTLHRTTGETLPIWAFDIKITTMGKGRDTTRRGSADYDMDELAPELAALPLYDLKKMTQPLPAEAQSRLLEGEDYNIIMTEHGLAGYYPVIGEKPVAAKPQEETDLF